jgi:DNA-directed RNA polymerase specialized sigma24 family protein
MSQVAENAESNQPKVEPRGLASPGLRLMVEKMVRRKVPAIEVDDLVQTVFVEALASDSRPDDDATLRRWLAGLTRNKVADFHRQGSRAKHVELSDQLADEAPPLEARDLAAWADKQTDNADDKRTLEWMAREGSGDKLAHIAADEKLPPTQVRQRVSRLRRMMKQRWAAELAAVAALVLLALIAWQLLRDDPIATPTPVPEVVPEKPVPEKPVPIAPRLAEAQRLRKDALEACAREAWRPCLEGLDAASELDPAGETDETKRLRELATDRINEEIRKASPDPSDHVNPPPAPSAYQPPAPAPPAPKVAPKPQNTSTPPNKPAPFDKKKLDSKFDKTLDEGKKSAPTNASKESALDSDVGVKK